MPQIQHLTLFSKFDGGVLCGKLQGKTVQIDVLQKPVFFKNDCALVLHFPGAGEDMEAPTMPQVEIEVGPGDVRVINHLVRSPELVRLCLQLQDEELMESLEIGDEVAEAVEYEG